MKFDLLYRIIANMFGLLAFEIYLTFYIDTFTIPTKGEPSNSVI
jgi:hypothetical protein